MALQFKEVELKKDDPAEVDGEVEVLQNGKQAEVVTLPDKEEEDASAALQKQIDALKKSEEIQRTRADQAERDRAAALQKVTEGETESVRLRKETFQSQFDAVSAALSGAQSEAESAKRDLRNALNAADIDAQVEAQERLATARATISKLEDGKIELEERIKAAPDKPVEKTQPNQDNTPALVKDWISRHRDYIEEPRKNDKIKALHWDAIDAGHGYGSQEYIDFIDIKCGFKTPPEVVDDDEEVDPPQRTQQRTSIVSAPVSREAPSTPNKVRGGQVKLNPAQREAAKDAGISEEEYAKQLRKLNEMKANGTYGDRQ